MTTVLLYLVLAVPKQNCKDTIKNARAVASAQLAAESKKYFEGVLKSSMTLPSTDAYSKAKADLDKVPADPQTNFEWMTTPPAPNRYGVCFDVFAKKVELELVK